MQNDELAVDLPKVLRVYADYDRFVQIMFNIIQNAIQFTKNGKIEISGRRLPKGAEFAIKDNGIGMTKEQTEQIWERFYKADRSRMNTQYGESGLGLAIVHHLVELHGGTIKVASELGKGTTFTLFSLIANTPRMPLHRTVKMIKLRFGKYNCKPFQF